MLQDFKAFIMRGNVIDMAVGIVIGVAFGALVNSFVRDVIMPPIGLALGDVDFSNLFVVLKEGLLVPEPYASLAEAQAAGAVSINYGVFINAAVSLLIVAAVLFFFVVRPVARMHALTAKPQEPSAPTTKDCPYCMTAIPIKASRCPNCTSELPTA